MVLDKLVNDIRDEPCLWSVKIPQRVERQQDAWRRVANRNKLSAVEVKLIFRELCKKYKEEKMKPKSSWKMYNQLKFLDKNEETIADGLQFKSESPIQAAPQQPIDEDIYVELLEVHEEDFSDDEMSPKDNSLKELESDSIDDSNESENKRKSSPKTTPPPNDTSSLLTSITKRKQTDISEESAHTKPTQPPEKQIKIEKSISASSATPSHLSNGSERGLKVVKRSEYAADKVGEVIQTNGSWDNEPLQFPVDIQSIKLEKLDNIILPLSNDTNNMETEAKSSKSRKDVCDEETTAILPHSRANNSFGQYVSNTLNALPEKLASKLEIKILEAIIAVNSERF